MMIGRGNISLVLWSVCLLVFAILGHTEANRWSRQVSNSEWIPLTNPRNHQGHNQNLAPPPLPQIHQPLIPGSLPPELRQEYQEQLLQLQKTQESIQNLLLLQQQLKTQQQLLQQGQGFSPSGLAESEENKQALHQSPIANSQRVPELAPEVQLPPQLTNQARPPVYTSQNFHEPQEQYEDYNDRQTENYKNPARPKVTQKEKETYVQEVPSGGDSDNGDDGEEEVQVVYVPAETLAQRGQSKNHQHNNGRKQFSNQDPRNLQQRPYTNKQRGQLGNSGNEREPVEAEPSPQEEAYAREFLQQLQREHEGTDRLLKEARERELERLREERKEIQRRAKLQEAAAQREQEIQRQREAEKSRKELAELEEMAKQHELQRIRESRERFRLEEMERSKKAQSHANEEKRKQEEARLAEIERLTALERQKKAEIERATAAQKELERVQKEEEERARAAERTHFTNQKEASKVHPDDAGASPQTQPLIRNHHNHQQQPTQSRKYNRHSRIRNNPRQRQHNQNIEHTEKSNQETTTAGPPSPNQPPLAVYMTNLPGRTRPIRITDVLKTLKHAKTIDVLDTVGQDAPRVFVGPSSLEVPAVYTKFDLPYLSAIDNNRVERRVDKLPFFVAPLSFNPPAGYSKIPFPAPHIGSVVINTLDANLGPAQTEDDKQSNLNPLIEPNSFSATSSQGESYDSATTPTYENYHREEPSTTSQYQSSPSYTNVEDTGPGQVYRFHQSYESQRPAGSGSQEQSRLSYPELTQSQPTHQEEPAVRPNHAERYNDERTGSTTPVYRRPNVVTSFSYQESPQPQSSTPTYQESYSNVRDDSLSQPINSQIGSTDSEVVSRYQLEDQRENHNGREYSAGQVDSIHSYKDASRGPTQYNLPAELPPIHPQLPGLVNSLLDEGQQAAFVNGQSSVPTRTTTTTTTTTTTEASPTTHRSRGRHRGRVVATRPSTTTTTSSPSTKARDNERTRRPFGRTRTRFTTTTEEYRNTYEPTQSENAATTTRYNVQENYRRTPSTKTQKFKSRKNDPSLHASRNQVHDVQAHEAANNGSPLLDSNSRIPETTGPGSNEPPYSQFNLASSTASLDNYPVTESDIRQVQNSPAVPEYSMPYDYPQARPLASLRLPNQEENISQQYEERYPTSGFGETGLEDAPINGFNYQIRNEQSKTTPNIPLPSRDFAYFQNKPSNSGSSHIPVATTESPINPQGTDFQHTTLYETSEDKTPGFGTNGDAFYDPYSLDNQGGLRTSALPPEQAPLEFTTEIPSTTSTTTEGAPVIIRQRVRGRLDGRRRPDSPIQTRPRGSQEEYVRFSAVNSPNIATTERLTPRLRENHRTRPKSRQQSHGPQIQTEGNDYVRIQAPIRTYQKTIVTPPSTTQRPTTTQAPTTTTVVYETPNDELEYGFIRPPNFNPIHPVGNRYQNSFRPLDSQAQLQSIVPSDETAEDTIQSHTQVTRNRPKYQTTVRRPTSKAVTLTTLATEASPYTDRSRTRVEETKNDRIRVRGRKPGRRRTTTTTTTTTEYVVEENNDLPLEENYPRPVQTVNDLGSDGQGFYDEKLGALPLVSEGSRSPNLEQHGENSFAGQDFALNFGAESDQIPISGSDQAQLSDQSSQKYDQSGGISSRTHIALQESQDPDIYGSESQWSTKLTSTSFQPSPRINRLRHNERKASFTKIGKNKYSNGDTSVDETEIITAPPAESYATVVVSPDDHTQNSASSSVDASLEASSFDEMNYGMKTSVQSGSNFFGSTPPTLIHQNTFERDSSISTTSSTDATDNTVAGNYGETIRANPSTRRAGVRRRRVRVRVRPALTDDFVTAESQHFNSAVNNLLQGRLKYNRRDEERKAMITTTPSPIPDELVTTQIPRETILEDLLEDVFNSDNTTNAESVITTSNESEASSTTPDYLKVTSSTTDGPHSNQNQFEVVHTTSDPLNEFTTLENSINHETTINDASIVDTTAYFNNENLKNIINSSTSGFPSVTPLMTTMTIPRKSWDSTKQYIDSIATHSGEPSSNADDNNVNDDFDDGTTGRINEVFENEYREGNSKNDGNKEDGNYPKNHRSEWSEVRYPTNHELYNYSRKLNLTNNQLPGVVTKSDGDTSVKTLSDYVKAIFDTMKNADEENNEQDTLTTQDSISTITNDFFENDENLENIAPTITPFVDSTTSSNETEYFSEKVVTNLTKNEDEENNFEQFETPGKTENSITEMKEESTEIPETTRYAEETTESSTDANFIGSSSRSIDSEFVKTSSTVKSIEPKYDETTTENSVRAIDTTQLNLGAVLRTSTTTKVSHMTEICYRGRCVMTRPKKEIPTR